MNAPTYRTCIHKRAMNFLALLLLTLGLLNLFTGLNGWRWWWWLWRDRQGRTLPRRYGEPTARLIFALVGVALILVALWLIRHWTPFLLGAMIVLAGLWLYLRLRAGS